MKAAQFCNRIGLLVAAVALVYPSAVDAQVSPMFFVDSFDDMDLNDGEPVNWAASVPEGTMASSASGDLVVTPQEAVFVAVENHTYDDVTVRTRISLPAAKPWYATEVFARADGTRSYGAGITSGSHPDSRTISIGGFFPDFESLVTVPTALDPAETDVVLQLDVVGDLLTLTAHAAGAPPESAQRVSVRDSRLTQGTIGVAHWDTCCFVGPRPVPTPATFRYFEAVPEPTTFALAASGLLVVLSRVRRRR